MDAPYTYLERLSPAKRALLRARLARQSRESRRPADRIARRDPNEGDVCSFGQQRFRFLEQLDEDGAVHNMSLNVRLVGRLDVDSLRRALEAIIHRHEPLRTLIRLEAGEPRPIMLPPASFELPVSDLRHLTEAETQTECEQRCASELMQSFDLSRDLSIRAALLRLADETHVLLMTIHHIASDGWSRSVLWRELWGFYDAFCHGQPPPFDALPVRYAEFAAWQRERLRGELLERLTSFWRRQLEGLAPLELPTEPTRSKHPLFHGQGLQFELPGELVQSVRALAIQANATLNMTLLAAFLLLLKRYSRQEDLAVGVPTNGRSRSELEPLIGYFVNTLVVRTDLSGNPTFRELVYRVRRASLEAYDHAELPFEKLVEELGPERSWDRNPLVSVLFQFADWLPGEEQVAGLMCQPLPPAAKASRYDLDVTFRTHGDGLRGTIIYREDLFDRARIERMAEQYRVLLQGAVANPATPVDNLEVLTGLERRQIVSDWNATQLAAPLDRGVHELFAEQAERTPAAIAVDDGVCRLTYGELDRAANRLARRLRQHGVGPESRVGIFLERTPAIVVAVLAIWKAGGAYVPLDTRFPRQRLQFLLEDAGVAVVVTRSGFDERISVPGNGTVFVAAVCDDEVETCDEPKSEPVEAGSDRVAYILHTSGSTGTPKGVAVTHRGVVNLLWSIRRITGFGPSDATLGITTLSFDISVLELMLPLVTGASVRLVNQDDAVDARWLRPIIERSNVTLLQATPTMWRMLLETGWRGSPHIHAISGGEALPRELADRLLDCVGTLWNMYGPTETTIYSTTVKIERGTTITIGRPIGNTQTYILDRALRPVPVGVTGELYIGGQGVARGYLGRPELTAARFVPDPFSAALAARLYRTGDLARYRPDGAIELIGRLDHQVKLRGFRIELGEIESVLAQHPAVARAAAAVRDDDGGEPRLVGYFVRSENEPVDSAALRQFLKERLPDYMVPAAWVELASLPLTAGGKLDRQALPAPDSRDVRVAERFVPPRDEFERQLAEIWSRLLRVERIGACDSFFDLGGHSVLSMQMLAEAERVFGKAPTLRSVFERPTLAQVAAAIQEQSAGHAVPVVRVRYVPPVPEAENPRPPLIVAPSLFGLSSEWERVFAETSCDRKVYGLEIEGNEPYWSEFPSLEEIADRFVQRIRAVIPAGPFHLAGHSFGAWLAYEVARQLEQGGTPPRSVIMVDAVWHGRPRTWRTRILRDVPSIVGNIPRWLAHHGAAGSRRDTVQRIARRLQAVASADKGRRATGDGGLSAATARASHTFDMTQLPDFYARRVVASMRAQAAYQPRPYHGRLAYLQCAVRPLIHRNDRDGGWPELVRGPVETHRIPGGHGSAINGSHFRELAGVIYDVMNRADQARAVQP
jgi:amino acid adenylation domain-containing protein